MQHYWKKFLRKSLEEEIRDNRNRSNLLISRENGGKTPENEETEQTEENKKTEKRTATTVHLEIRELVKAGDLDAARTVLKQAVEDGYKGKRLDRWATVLLDDLGKVAKNKEEQFKKTKKKTKTKQKKI